MKTLLIYHSMENPPQYLEYLVVDGDYSRFNGVVVNGCEEHINGYEKEFYKFAFNDMGERVHTWSSSVSLIEEKKWDKVAVVTFL